MYALIFGKKEITSKKDGNKYYLVDGALIDDDGLYPIPYNQNFIDKSDYDTVAKYGNGLYACKCFRGISNLVFAGKINPAELILLADNK